MKRIIVLSYLLFVTWAIYSQNTEELTKQFMKGEYSKVIEGALPLVKQFPDDISLKLLLGRAYTNTQQYKEAIPFLDEAMDGDKSNGWIKGWSLSCLGTCHFFLSDFARSQECLRQCIDLNATQNVTNQAIKQFAFYGFDKDFRIIEKDHIIFHFQQKAMDKITDIEKYMIQRELAFDSLSRFFNARTPRKINFFAWESNEEAMSSLKTQIGFANPEMCIIHARYNQTIGHELTHVISNYSEGMQKKTRLINEGAAVYFDMSGRNKMNMAARVFQDADSISIRLMWSNSASSIPEMYFFPVAGAFTEYLIQSGGKDKFLKLFVNQTIESAYDIYGQELDSIIQGFERKFADSLSVEERNSIREKNIKLIDSSIDKVALANPSAEKAPILLHNKAYSYEDYQLQKHNLKILTKGNVETISYLKGQSAEAIQMAFKQSTSDGVFIITVGNMPSQNNVEMQRLD